MDGLPHHASLRIDTLNGVFRSRHRVVLRDFTRWNLAQFIQARNPNVSQVVDKLVRPPDRPAC